MDGSKAQTQVEALDQALGSLAEATNTILCSAISLEERLIGHTPSASAPITIPEPSIPAHLRLALLPETEARVRKSLGRVREALSILQGIERKIQA